MKIRPFQFPFLGSNKRSLLAKEIRRSQFAMAISMMKKSAELSAHCMLSSGAGPKNVIERRESLPFPSFYHILRKKRCETKSALRCMLRLKCARPGPPGPEKCNKKKGTSPISTSRKHAMRTQIRVNDALRVEGKNGPKGSPTRAPQNANLSKDL